jgi:hypothetical protein
MHWNVPVLRPMDNPASKSDHFTARRQIVRMYSGSMDNQARKGAFDENRRALQSK